MTVLRGCLMTGRAIQFSQQQLARVNPASIDNPVVRIAGLILGSPEFQKQ